MDKKPNKQSDIDQTVSTRFFRAAKNEILGIMKNGYQYIYVIYQKYCWILLSILIVFQEFYVDDSDK